MKTGLFDFELPDACIALEPAARRDGARLLHITNKADAFGDRQIADLPSLLRAGDVVVFNNTKVIPAQLSAQRPPRHEGGGETAVNIDITLLEQKKAHTDKVAWSAFVRPAKRVKQGDMLHIAPGFSGTVIERDGPEVWLEFPGDAAQFTALLKQHGKPPLPPYIARKRALSVQDDARYQTVYAAIDGSVAAPTAGLHFTPQLLEQIDQAGAQRIEVTLHVGAGTFLPVSVDDVENHVMHAEWGEVSNEAAEQINQARAKGGRIIVVGTTSLRLLESAADEHGVVHPFSGKTDIFITPGYRFKAMDALVTNFHLPRSTLFMLVCSIGGIERMQAAYRHAIEAGYRFYSYGDACYIERHD